MVINNYAVTDHQPGKVKLPSLNTTVKISTFYLGDLGQNVLKRSLLILWTTEVKAKSNKMGKEQLTNY